MGLLKYCAGMLSRRGPWSVTFQLINEVLSFTCLLSHYLQLFQNFLWLSSWLVISDLQEDLQILFMQLLNFMLFSMSATRPFKHTGILYNCNRMYMIVINYAEIAVTLIEIPYRKLGVLWLNLKVIITGYRTS